MSYSTNEEEDAIKVDPTLEYVNSIVNGTENEDDEDEFHVSITNSPTPSRPPASECRSPNVEVRFAVSEQRMDRLESMICATFDAVRQVSHQIYSVDSKLADLVARSTVNALTMAQQQGLALNSDNSKDTIERAIGCNNSNIQIQIGRKSNDSLMTRKVVLKSSSLSQMDVNETEGDGSRKSTWDERFEELKFYKGKYGHCNVPQLYESGLGTWVSAQRSQYKRFKSGKTSSMTKKRQQDLEELGFAWSLRKRHSWEERFNELKAFSEANDGSCDVQNEGELKGLWAWCQKQRVAYKTSAEGKGPIIPRERVLKMEEIGFNWLLPIESVSISSSGSTSESSSQITADSPLSAEHCKMDDYT